ncbi:MAG: hypothetical protein HDS57_01995 [Barnesiella sp.]|nr:hypothetical protein [Barnesiella sp.]
MKPFAIIFSALLLASLFPACGPRVDIDISRPPHAQAAELVAEMSPQELAEALVNWMAKASPTDRDYVRTLTREIVSAYDSTDNYASRHFAHALDSVKETLSVEKLARVYVVASKPSRLAVILREEGADTALIREIRRTYATDTVGLRAFDTNYFIR